MYQTVFYLMLPEIFLSVMTCVMLLVSVFSKQAKSSLPYYLSILILIGTMSCLWFNCELPKLNLLADAVIIDQFSTLMKMFLCGIALVVFIYSKNYIQDRNLLTGEYFALSLFSILGCMILFSSGNFLTLYLGLELMALPIYALLALAKDDPRSSEAAMKYFIMGALGSGLLLFGISLLYGITGTLEFDTAVISALTCKGAFKMVSHFAVVFLLAGIGFKLGIVPFHMWVPDIYEGSVTSLTLFIATVTKVGAFALAYRLFSEVLLVLNVDWEKLLMLMGVLSVILGSVVGLAQDNFKKMLAYSAIAHFGFIALGFSVVPTSDFSAVTFYLLAYTLITLGALGVMLLLSYKGFEAEKLQDLRGLVVNSPVLAILMALFMLALAGVPPTVGFYAKLLIIKNLIAADMLNVVVLILVFSVVAAFYYLRIIKLMFFNKSNEITINYSEIMRTWPGSALLYVNGLAVLLLGVFPGAVLYLLG